MRRKWIVTWAAVVGLSALAAQTQASVIAGYSFGADASHLTLAATASDANVTATAIAPSSSAAVSVATINGSSYYGAGSTIMTINRAVTNLNNQYVYFTVTVADGNVLNLTGLTFNAAMGGSTGPRTLSVANSVDGLSVSSAVAVSSPLLARGTMTSYSYDFSGSAYQGLSSFTVRFYFDTPTVAQNIDVDSIQLSGNVAAVAAVPEPTSLAVLSLLAGGWLLWKSKK